ncbi:hypothetical protein B0H16DRAFT_1514596 [Mycena metata]|uniref:Uncharacterized protein n=1 Tax=Mycena metata TaxID=1033252 RepID=A0AAD7JTV6_9AGAR|nr:hypothetical protein B0H16DRAFT_1514596 [Mycena metata]
MVHPTFQTLEVQVCTSIPPFWSHLTCPALCTTASLPSSRSGSTGGNLDQFTNPVWDSLTRVEGSHLPYLESLYLIGAAQSNYKSIVHMRSPRLQSSTNSVPFRRLKLFFFRKPSQSALARLLEFRKLRMKGVVTREGLTVRGNGAYDQHKS